MGRGSVLALLLSAAIACGTSASPTGADEPGGKGVSKRTGPTIMPHELEIVSLEAKRASAIPRLVALTKHADVRVQLRAVRALGRVGGKAALAHLRGMIVAAVPNLRAAVVDALAIAIPFMGDAEKTALANQLSAVLGAKPGAVVAVSALRGLGKVGAVGQEPSLAGALSAADVRVREAAALALGRFGRRKLAMNRDVQSTLRRIALALETPAKLRWAATYALANEHKPRSDDHTTIFALTRLSRHSVATVRAVALRGLSRRYLPVAYDERKPFIVSLGDGDWRVRVQAVRALTQPPTNAEDHAALATWLVRELVRYLVGGRRSAQRIQPIVEGLKVLAPFAREASVQTAADAMFQIARKRMRAGAKTAGQRLANSMLHCLTAALRVRGGANFAALSQCGGARDRGWPNHLRRQVEISAVGDGLGGTLRARFERLYAYAGDKDPRVRGAALTQLAKLVEQPAYTPVVTRALQTGMADKAIEVAGAVAEVASGLVKSNQNSGLANKLIAVALTRLRGAKAVDPELHITLLGLFSTAKHVSAVDVCRTAHTAANASVRHAGRRCITALTSADPGQGASGTALVPPPVDVRAVVGYSVTWTIQTSRGAVTIALNPSIAPWHVATVVELSRRKVYDGLLFHRVVPDFVIQGGDPRGSGWGGPGYVVPGEPSTSAYDTGAVGIADAGLDTGGSQWFVMHSPAPRLDNRYTKIGRVVSGQRVIDSLVVGDRIVRARVRIAP